MATLTDRASWIHPPPACLKRFDKTMPKSPYTRRGKKDALAARASDASGITTIRSATGEASGFTVDTLKLAIPERSYRASTGSYVVHHSECFFNFAQLRAPSNSRVQSAVAVVMPLAMMRGLTLNPQVSDRIDSAARGGSFPPFPADIDAGDYQSITYEAQCLRLLINEQLGCAIDFFQIPVEPPTNESINVHGVLRVTTSPSLFAAFSRWCTEVTNQ